MKTGILIEGLGETNFIGDSEIGSIGIKIISKEWYSKKVGLIKWNELKQLILIYLVLPRWFNSLKTIRNTDETNKLSNNFFSLIIILYFGKFLLYTFFSSFLYIIINSISKDFINICKKIGIKINELISFFGILLVSFLFFYFILKILKKINVSSALQNVTLYENNLKKIILNFRYFINQIFPFKNYLTEFNFINLFSNFLNF